MSQNDSATLILWGRCALSIEVPEAFVHDGGGGEREREREKTGVF
jgi:hypothetical protein